MGFGFARLLCQRRYRYPVVLAVFAVGFAYLFGELLLFCAFNSSSTPTKVMTGIYLFLSLLLGYRSLRAFQKMKE